jgi:hypothetical protein
VTTRLLGQFAVPDALLYGHAQMRLDFLVQFRFKPPPVK